MQVYSDRFGAYPYSDMDIVQAPLTYHGMEFPGMNLIGGQTYNKFLQDLEMLTVHEVAHQWWYNQVGNDQVLTPWLDEGLAEFSTQYYYRDRWGDPTAEQLQRTRWAAPVADAERRGKDAPIGKAVTEYENNYETMVYGKGALFFAALRDQLGPDAFDQLLRTYLERYRWKIATPAEFQALAEEVSGRDLDALFNEWVYGQDGTEQLGSSQMRKSMEQRAAYTALLQTLGSASHDEIPRRAGRARRRFMRHDRANSRPKSSERLRETLYPPKA